MFLKFWHKGRRWLILPIDCVLAASAFYLAWVLRFDSFNPDLWSSFPGWSTWSVLLCIQLGCITIAFSAIGIYKNIWAYASLHDIYKIMKATILAALLSVSVSWLYNRLEDLPRSAIAIEYMLLFLFLSFRSFSWRMLREVRIWGNNRGVYRSLIIGTGLSAVQLARELRESRSNYIPIIFLDLNKKSSNTYLQGLPVIGGLDKLLEGFKRYNINQLIVSEKIGGKDMRFVYRSCENSNVKCKVLPPITEVLDSSQDVGKAIREMQLEDLLGRDPVKLETSDIYKCIEGRTILVTGAGGSIGRELCRQILRYKPGALLLLDIAENSLYEIDHELRYESAMPIIPRMAAIVGDMSDDIILQKVFKENDVHVVFHCAAYKHVPLMEMNPSQAIQNNLLGTVKLAKTAHINGVERFVMLSTDKAVNPVNIMGATKRIAELYIQNLGRSTDTCFVAVRFGNVLGSQGSVIPLFSKQIQRGGPITITHPEITRYFMTIPEAVGLVIQAGVLGSGGEIFILDMGEPVKIKELAEDMIHIAGLRVAKDIQLQYTGLRPGEKLFEELLSANEGQQATQHSKIYKALGHNLSLATLTEKITKLDDILYKNDRAQIDNLIAEILPEYQPVYRSQPIKMLPSSHEILSHSN